MAKTLSGKRKQSPSYKQTWRYWKKPKEYRSRKIFLEIFVPQSNFYILEPEGITVATHIPAGKYEVEIIKHPYPDRAQDHRKRWICFEWNGTEVGAAIGFVRGQEKQGEVVLYIRKNIQHE